MEKEYWKTKLNAFDAQLCNMVESLTGVECEPKNGGDHYFIEPSYKSHNDPQFILALWDAIEGRAGNRLMEIHDDPGRWSEKIQAGHYYLQPCDMGNEAENAVILAKTIAYIKKHPIWRLSLQTQKIINVR